MADRRTEQPSMWFLMAALVAAIVAGDIAKQHLRGSAAIGIGACLIGLMSVARVRWDLRSKWWFWLALLAGAGLQLPLVFLMPWSDRYLTGTGAMAYVIPGFLMALGCVFLAEKIFANSSSPK